MCIRDSRKIAITNAANEVTRQSWNLRNELLQTTDAASRSVKRKYDEGGNQTFGLFQRDYQPRKAAVYLHNLTTILADQGSSVVPPGQLHYAISDQPGTTHELLLQKSDGTFWLVVWSERLKGADEVTVQFRRSYAAVKVYDPTVGTVPVETSGRIESLKLTLSDHPLILAFTQE